MSAKEKIIKFIKNLPDILSEEEIAYHIYVREEIKIAENEVQKGKLVDHKEVKEMYKKWL